jgi:hypothetical protein
VQVLKLEIAKRCELDVPGRYEPEGARPFLQHWVRAHKKVWYESSIEVLVSGRLLRAEQRHDEYECGPLKDPRYQDMIAHKLRRMVVAEIERTLFQGA